MSNPDTENPPEPPRAESLINQPPATSPANKVRNFVNEKTTTFLGFFRTIYGILNLIIIIALICVLISAGTADTDQARTIDSLEGFSSVKVKAYHTRNADIAFAAIGLILVIADIFLYTTGLIKRLPKIFDFIFNIVMIVIGLIYLILGCCSAAWAKKASDTRIGNSIGWGSVASAVASSFFLFTAMIAVLVEYGLRFFRPIRRDID